MANEVHSELLDLLTKKAQPTIRPSPAEQSIDRPDYILDKPGKELALRGSPSPPNRWDHGSGGKTSKLRLVRQGRGVLPIGVEFSSDGVLNSLGEVSMRKLFPKVGKLLNVF